MPFHLNNISIKMSVSQFANPSLFPFKQLLFHFDYSPPNVNHSGPCPLTHSQNTYFFPTPTPSLEAVWTLEQNSRTPELYLSPYPLIFSLLPLHPPLLIYFPFSFVFLFFFLFIWISFNVISLSVLTNGIVNLQHPDSNIMKEKVKIYKSINLFIVPCHI